MAVYFAIFQILPTFVYELFETMQSSVTRSRTSITKSLPASFKLSIFALSSESYIKIHCFIRKNVSFCFFLFDYCLLFLHSATLAQSFRYNPLKLSIRGTEFIRRPFLDSFHGFRVHSEHKAFYRLFLCHFLH